VEILSEMNYYMNVKKERIAGTTTQYFSSASQLKGFSIGQLPLGTWYRM